MDIAGPPGRSVPSNQARRTGSLVLGRGVPYSVQARDLLQGMGFLGPEEVAVLNHFHRAMYDVVRSLSNEEFDYNLTTTAATSDEVYNNQFAAHLTSLVAIGRLLGDRGLVEEALYGGNGRLRLPWVMLFNYVLYGVDDQPLLKMAPNTGQDALSSRPAYSSPVVAPGEINDRYRNANPLQGIGYPMGTLEALFMVAESLRIASLDAYAYRGTHRQSIEMSAAYYACFAKGAGFKQTVTAGNAASCPDYQQYLGRVVNDVETVILMGAYRFSGNSTITDLEVKAREAAAKDPIDAIRFGKWRD